MVTWIGPLKSSHLVLQFHIYMSPLFLYGSARIVGVGVGVVLYNILIIVLSQNSCLVSLEKRLGSRLLKYPLCLQDFFFCCVKGFFNLNIQIPAWCSPNMFLATFIFLLASLCNAAQPSNPHKISLAPRAVNNSIPKIILEPMTNTSLVSFASKHC